MLELARLLYPIRCAHDRGACGAHPAYPPACPGGSMQRLRPLLAGIALVVLACLGMGAAAAAPRPPANQKLLAMAAGSFVDSVGVNLAPADAAAGWALAQRLEAAGIRHVTGPAATRPPHPATGGPRGPGGGS